MCSKTTLATLATAVLIFAFATPASAAPSEDACALITAAQVTSIVGVAVGNGTHVTPTYVKTCTWTPSGGAKGLSAVTVSYQPATSFAGARQMAAMMEANSKGKMANSSATGIGDDAFYTNMGNYTALLVKKGNISFKVAIYGAVPPDKAKAMEKSIALQALSKI
jgi:hypothetical protein